jgi:hypothetical protein
MWRCRSPSRCRTICSAARSPTRSISRRSRRRKRRSVKPFIALAEKLGSFAGPAHGIRRSRSIRRSPTRARCAELNTKPLTAAAIAGVLRPMLSDVNVVSAPIVAKERGMVIDEVTRAAGRRLRVAHHRDGGDRPSDPLDFGHRVPRWQAAHRQHQGHQRRR